eukprot:6591-Heterococcus_DN1.PRE.1
MPVTTIDAAINKEREGLTQLQFATAEHTTLLGRMLVVAAQIAKSEKLSGCANALQLKHGMTALAQRTALHYAIGDYIVLCATLGIPLLTEATLIASVIVLLPLSKDFCNAAAECTLEVSLQLTVIAAALWYNLLIVVLKQHLNSKHAHLARQSTLGLLAWRTLRPATATAANSTE